jgi:hypothetical protein
MAQEALDLCLRLVTLTLLLRNALAGRRDLTGQLALSPHQIPAGIGDRVLHLPEPMADLIQLGLGLPMRTLGGGIGLPQALVAGVRGPQTPGTVFGIARGGEAVLGLDQQG